MPAAKLTKDQARRILDVLHRARSGKVTLPELTESYTLASRSDLPGTEAELHEHLRRAVGTYRGRPIERDLLFGIMTGMLTHYLVRGGTGGTR